MTTPTWVERIVRGVGCAAAYATLAVLLYGIWRGTRQTHGRISGQMESLLRSPWFYAAATALFLGLCRLGWIPIPVSLSPLARAWTLGFGCLLYFPGLGLLLWGRLALGRYYFVATSSGAQLFTGHRLITSGPYGLVRHPMYLGLVSAACGSLLIYATWTTLFFALFAPCTLLRARREEAVLAAEFGAEWRNYCQRVPAFFPQIPTLKKRSSP